MQKIPTLFVRDPETNLRYVKDEVHEDCEWVINGEGFATRKFDGTCVMLDQMGYWWARREVKFGKEEPANFVAISYDPLTKKTMGWEPIDQSPFIKFFDEARSRWEESPKPGTYELCGPKINGNPEILLAHRLLKHGSRKLENVPLTFQWLYYYLPIYKERYGMEGVVWHHPDGRMAKLKAKDFPN